MRVITVARKPLAGTVAQTALKFGTGGINIDECRISTSDNLWGGAYAKPSATTEYKDRPCGFEDWRYKRGGAGEFQQPTGRFPANLILCHLPGCTWTGTKEITTDTHFSKSRPQGSQTCGPSGHEGQLEEVSPKKETVPAWECVEDCPVRNLDGQSGSTQSAVRQGGEGEHLDPSREDWRFKRAQGGFTDSGGASRFFKQVRE